MFLFILYRFLSVYIGCYWFYIGVYKFYVGFYMFYIVSTPRRPTIVRGVRSIAPLPVRFITPPPFRRTVFEDFGPHTQLPPPYALKPAVSDPYVY